MTFEPYSYLQLNAGGGYEGAVSPGFRRHATHRGQRKVLARAHAVSSEEQ